jgi:hypothetical protein
MENRQLPIGEYKNNESNQTQRKEIPINIPLTTLNSLKREFNLSSEAEIGAYITCLIDRAVTEHIAEANSNVFSDSEVKELEDDLKGLGYI